MVVLHLDFQFKGYKKTHYYLLVQTLMKAMYIYKIIFFNFFKTLNIQKFIMKNLILLFLGLLFIKCSSQNLSIKGDWSYIEKNGEYKELNIDDKSIRVTATTGVQENMFEYNFDGKTLTVPYFKYKVKIIDNCYMVWYNSKDTVYFERIFINNIKKQGPNVFMIRKYNYLISHNYISGDSAINKLLEFKNLNQNKDMNIQEFEIKYKDSMILQPIHR